VGAWPGVGWCAGAFSTPAEPETESAGTGYETAPVVKRRIFLYFNAKDEDVKSPDSHFF